MTVKLTERERFILDELIAIRKQKRIRVNEVARRIGITAGAVSNFEAGYHSPTLGRLLVHMEAIGADLIIVEAESNP